MSQTTVSSYYFEQFFAVEFCLEKKFSGFINYTWMCRPCEDT